MRKFSFVLAPVAPNEMGSSDLSTSIIRGADRMAPPHHSLLTVYLLTQSVSLPFTYMFASRLIPWYSSLDNLAMDDKAANGFDDVASSGRSFPLTHKLGTVWRF